MPAKNAQRRSLLARLTVAASWSYAAAVAGAWAALYAAGDRWWWGAALLYGPRWVLALPLAALFPAAIWFHRRALATLAISAAIVAGPVLGSCVPWRSWLAPSAPGRRVRLLTCNLNAMKSGFERFETLVAELKPDVIVLQECSDEAFVRFTEQSQWHVERRRSLCVASRWPLRKVEWLTDDGRLGYWGDFAVRCEVSVPVGKLTLLGVHLETPREGLEELLHYGWKARETVADEIVRRAAISAAARGLLDRSSPSALVAGDFNLPAESAIYQHDWATFNDAFTSAGFGLGHTKRLRWFGIRIDHILAGPAWRVERCWVGPPIGSDHRPLIADLALPNAG